MKKDMEMHGHNCEHCHGHRNWKKESGGIYFLGFIGALIYYLQTSTGLGNVLLGILKAIVWPAFLIHKLLGL